METVCQWLNEARFWLFPLLILAGMTGIIFTWFEILRDARREIDQP